MSNHKKMFFAFCANAGDGPEVISFDAESNSDGRWRTKRMRPLKLRAIWAEKDLRQFGARDTRKEALIAFADKCSNNEAVLRDLADGWATTRSHARHMADMEGS